MLSETELYKYINDRHTLSGTARDYIHSVRNNDPSRMVGVHAKNNVVGGVVSKKMGFSITSESRSAEKAFILLSEYDDRVLEMWCQPQPIKVCRTNKNGEKSWGSYTSDFMLLTKVNPQVVQVKTKKAVEALLKEKPKDWVRESGGEVVYIPAQKAFSELGLIHKVFVYSSDQRYLIDNLDLLMQSRKSNRLDSNLQKKILGKFEDSFSWSLYDLKNELNINSYTPIIQCIDMGLLFFNKSDELLSFAKGCLLARTEEMLGIAKQLNYQEKIFSDNEVLSHSVLKFPSDKYAKDTLKKLELIKSGISNRSIRRWKSNIREGEKKGLTPFQSLISKRYLSGNRARKIHISVEKYLMDYLTNEHVNKQGVSDYRSYVSYRVSAKNAHSKFDPVSLTTFKSRLNQLPPEIVAFGHGGKRLANSVADPSDPFERALKPQLAWQVGAIDHCLAKIFLVCVENSGEVYVMRPWITAMIDVCTSSVLAISISFSSPSRRSDAKVIRECVRRHGRLPSEIIVDRGSDFTSVFFVSLLAHYEVDYSSRPSGYSRFGGEIEGLFKEFINQWLCQKQGNTVDYKNARSFDGKLAPSKKAIMKPYDFLREFNAYLSWRDSTSRGIGILSAQTAMKKSQNNYPFVGVSVEYNHEFMLATAVESKEYKINFQRGIHKGGLWYYHPDIAKVRGKKSKLEVRLDPENPHIIYALIDNSWVTCASSRINTYSAKDPISQFVDGLLLLETSSIRNKAKIEADEQLAHMIKEMDNMVENDSLVPVLQVDISNDKTGQESIFKQLENAVIEPVSIERWSTH